MARTALNSSGARICDAPLCSKAIPASARADALYCSTKCRRRVAKRRYAAKKRLDAGLPPTATDIEQLRHDELRRRTSEAQSDAPTQPTAKPINLLSSQADKKVLNSFSPTDLRRAGTTADGNTIEQIRQFLNTTRVGGEGFINFINSPLLELLAEGQITQADIASHFKVSTATASQWVYLFNSSRNTALEVSSWYEDPEVQAYRESFLTDDAFLKFSETFFPEMLVPWFHKEWDAHITDAITEGKRTLLLAAQRHGKTEWLMRQCLWRILRDPDITIIWVGATATLASKAVGWIREQLEFNEDLRATFLPPDTSFKPPATRRKSWKDAEFTVSTRTKILKSPTMVALGVGTKILGRDARLIVIDDPIDHESSMSPTERASTKRWFKTDFISREEEHTAIVYIGSRQHHDDLPNMMLQQNQSELAAGRTPKWEVHVYRAHDLGCLIPLEDHPPESDAMKTVMRAVTKQDESGYSYTDYEPHEVPYPHSYEDTTAKCILWPSFRSPQYLADKYHDDPVHFARNYQANPTSDAYISITQRDLNVSSATDAYLSKLTPYSMVISTDDGSRTATVMGWSMGASRRLGVVPPHTRLVASVDPAMAKPNAIVLWAYSPLDQYYSTPPVPEEPKEQTTIDGVPSQPRLTKVRAIVDQTFTPQPGSPGLRNIIQEWYERYHVTDWVFETNNYKDQIQSDIILNDLKSRYGLRFLEHATGVNKHNHAAGVMAMLNGFKARPPRILLPGSHPEDKRALSTFFTQCLQFDPEARIKGIRGAGAGIDDDLVMAAWVGWHWIEKQNLVIDTSVEYDYPDGFNDSWFDDSSVVGGLGGIAGVDSPLHDTDRTLDWRIGA